MNGKVMGSAPWGICAGVGVMMSHLKAQGRSEGVNRRGYLRLEVFLKSSWFVE
jgi:hypothetical protein